MPLAKGNGKKKGKGSSKTTKSRAPADPTKSDLYFPREIISNIISRLPVKILLRFRCVCKQLRNLISKPSFIAAHFRHSSALQRSGSYPFLYTPAITRPLTMHSHCTTGVMNQLSSWTTLILASFPICSLRVLSMALCAFLSHLGLMSLLFGTQQ
uniref:F-box protein At2g19630 n=1 Tax=Nicotiana sylvestris TaxID=4096 RepID=A0A1U7V1W5_NICSY|nr:PREDICTED: putative F-box protein At2g19630 [Nicotiana sylvestris]